MKVVLPINGLRFASKEILPASCTSKPPVSYTSANMQVEKGLSNQEIYEGLINAKNQIVSLFVGKKIPKAVNYLI